VTEDEVISMNRRLSGGDASLNATIGGADDEGSTQWQDWLEDEAANQATDYAERTNSTRGAPCWKRRWTSLNERERDILTQRRLSRTR
jgi:RNA polymerase sigma-32 factor